MIATAEDVQITAIPQPERDMVDLLLASYAYYPYRHWRGFGADVPRHALRWDLLHGHRRQGSMWLLARNGTDVVGLVLVEPSPWESEWLVTSIGELRHLITLGDRTQRQAIAEALLATVRQRLRGSIECLLHRVDVDDYATMAALQTQGFRLVDTTISFIRGREFRPYLRRRFRRPCPVRPYRDEDWPAVEAIARQSHFGGRLYNDPRFARPRVDALYLEWVRRCCQRDFADEVIVALRHDHIGGFLSYQFQRGLYEAARIRLVGRGLLAVGPEHRGLALELIRGASLSEVRADFLQCDIHLENLDLLGLYGRALRMDVAHIQHVFHGWLDTGPEANRVPLSDDG